MKQTCEISDSKLPLAYIPFAVLMMIPNLTLFIAVITSKNIVRHNVVYYYVTSMLLSPIFLGILIVYESGNLIGSWEAKIIGKTDDFRFDDSVRADRYLLTWFVLRRSLLSIMTITANFNMAGLTYGISSTSYFIGRYLAFQSSSVSSGIFKSKKKKLSKVKTFRSHKIRAYIIIPLTWLVPLLICIVALSWNCATYCQCVPAQFHTLDCQGESEDMTCSIMWPPLSNVFLLSLVIPWVVMHIFHFCMLLCTIRTFYVVMERPSHSKVGMERSIEIAAPQRKKTLREKFGRSMKPPPSKLTPRDPIAIEKMNTAIPVSTKFKTLTLHSHPRNLREMRLYDDKNFPGNNYKKRPNLDPMIKLLLFLSIANLVCMAPIMTICALDALRLAPHDSIYFVFCHVPILIYFTGVPIVLTKYMSGLKKALNHLTFKLPCLRQTVITSSSKSVAVHSGKTQEVTIDENTS